MYKLSGREDWASLAVHMALEELAVPFEYIQTIAERGDMATQAYLAMNPFGLLPVLQTPDGPLFETTAILLYIADRHGALAPATDAPDRGGFLVWLAVVCQQLHPTVLQILHPYRVLGEAHQNAVSQAAHARMQHILTQLQAQAATGDKWLSGVHPSILAIYSAMLLRWAQALALVPSHALDLRQFPALLAMAQALEARAPIQRVLQRENLYSLGPNPLSAPVIETA